jgi:hypothetical protein
VKIYLPSALYCTPFISLKHAWVANELKLVGGQQKILSCVGRQPEKFVWKFENQVIRRRFQCQATHQLFMMLQVTPELIEICEVSRKEKSVVGVPDAAEELLQLRESPALHCRSHNVRVFFLDLISDESFAHLAFSIVS